MLTLRDVQQLLRPLSTRIANTVARGVVKLVNDAKKQQIVQLGVLAGETVDDGESFHPYGFSSVPLAGAEAVVLFPNGDRSHPVVVAVSDRRHRPTGGEAGEVTVYNHTGAKVVITKDGDIVATPAPGREFIVGGGAHKLVTVDEFNLHTHPAPGGATSAPTDPALGADKTRTD